MNEAHTTGRGRSIFRIARALVVTSLIVGVVAPLPAHAAPEPYPDDLTLVVEGGGWGHGHGMSQYGARAAAEDGLTYERILAHYYSDVTFEDRGDPRVRVLLSSGPSVIVGGPERTTARWRDGSVIHRSSDGYPFTRARATADGVAIAKAPSAGGPWTWVAKGTGHVRFSADDAVAVPVSRSGRLEYFRSIVEAYRRGEKTMYAINELRLNEYLYGVVPREMPALWHARALRAQAVAARSYTLWKRNNAGSGGSYHICATTSCQVYRGFGVRETLNGPMEILEHPRTNDAIDATRGVTMVYPGEGPIFAEYNSSSGGYTAQGSRAYLAPVADPYDERYSPYHRWTDAVTVSDILRRWPSLGHLVRIAFPKRDGHGPFGGRVQTMKLVGTDATVTLSGDTFRSAMGLRSTLFQITVYDAEQAQAAAEVALAPGTEAPAELLVRNTGTAAWPVGDTVQLGTWPKNSASPFASSTWITPTRPAGIAADASDGNDSVAPGQVAVIRFALSAAPDAIPGLYTERFRMVLPGTTWFGSVLSVPVRVGADGVSHLGGNLVSNPSFEALDDDRIAEWRPVAGRDPAVSERAIDGMRSLGLPSAHKSWTRVRQTIERAGRRGHRFVLSGWHRASVTGEGTTLARAVLRGPGGRTTRATLSFPGGSHGWTYRETALVADHRFDRIQITLATSGQRGRVWFDRIGVARQNAINGGFEAGGRSPTGWTLVRARASDGAAIGRVRQGTRALRLSGRDDSTVLARQELPHVRGAAGDRLRLGGWTRAIGVSASGGAIQLRARLHLRDGSTVVETLDVPRAEHEWVYGETTLVAPASYDGVDLYLWVDDQSGAVSFDDVVFAPVGSAQTITANASFEVGAPTPGMWLLGHAGRSTVARPAGSKGDVALHLHGARTRDRYARQPIPVGGAAGERFVLSGWNKTAGSDRTRGPVQIRLLVIHADGTSGNYRIGFARRPHDWIFRERTITTAKPFVAMHVYARFAQQTGDAWFDLIRVRREV